MKQTRLILSLLLAFSFSFLTIAQSVNQVDADGNKEGKWVKYFSNTKIKYEGQFHNDMPNGKFTYYYNTGDIKSVVDFTDDGIIGRSTTYYKNGKLMSVGKYLNQKKDSVWFYYLNEASNPLISLETYINGILEGESITYYTETGEPAEIVTYRNDKKDGRLIKFFPDGVLMTESSYKDGLPEGDFKHYHPDGKIQIIGKYKDGIQQGNWKYFNESGNEVEESEFIKHEEVKEIKETQ